MGRFNAKRLGPKEVAPLTHGGVRYEVIMDDADLENGFHEGVVGAFDTQTGTLLRRTVIYRTVFKKSLETDVQEVYISGFSLTPDGRGLLIRNEKQKSFLLDLELHTVKALD